MFPLENLPQHNSNRTRVEILASILTVASRGALKTHIMYKANLSHRQLEKYLQFLEESGLLLQISDPELGSRHYRVTEKGMGFLKDYSQLSGYFTAKVM
jgi:predicted transcriptional regulator